MQASNHHIGSIRLEIRGADPQQAWPLREELDALLRGFCEEELVALLDEVDRDGQHLLIPSLQLNLGQVTTAGMRDKLEQQLREILQAYGLGVSEEETALQYTAPAGEALPEATLRSVQQRQQDHLFHYLRYGYFPWGINNEEIRSLLDLFRQDPESLLSGQSPSDLLQPQLIRRITELAQDAGFKYLLQLLYTLWQGTALPDPLLSSMSPEAITGIFGVAAVPEDKYMPVLSQLVKAWNISASAAAGQLLPGVAAYALLKIYIIAGKPPEAMPAAIQHYLQEIPDTEEELIPLEAEAAEVVAAPVIVPFLGLVLLHPFIPAFLKGLGLLNERQQFPDEESRMIALGALLQLCQGDVTVPEYHMLFPKMLLGIPLDTVPERQLWETGKTLFEEEANVLLQSVIGHWSALRQTSVAGLRESFLQRRGRLHTEENKIMIKIERSGFDMLLDRLPWSYSEIHFPWLQPSIQTEW